MHVFASAVGRVVVAHKLKVLLVFGVLLGPMVGMAVTISDPSVQNANPYWGLDTPLGRRWGLEAFALRNASRDSGIEVDLVFGIETIDRTGTDPTDDRDLGVAVFYDGFDFAQPESQEYVLWLCDEIERERTLLSLERVRCLPRELRAWRLARHESWPVPPAHYTTVAREFLRRDAARGVNRQLGFTVVGDELHLKFAHIKALTDVHFASVLRTRVDLKRRWREFAASLPSRRSRRTVRSS